MNLFSTKTSADADLARYAAELIKSCDELILRTGRVFRIHEEAGKPMPASEKHRLLNPLLDIRHGISEIRKQNS